MPLSFTTVSFISVMDTDGMCLTKRTKKKKKRQKLPDHDAEFDQSRR